MPGSFLALENLFPFWQCPFFWAAKEFQKEKSPRFGGFSNLWKAVYMTPLM